MLKKIIKNLNKLEYHIRVKLGHYPILYAFVGGVGVVLFWRGVWHTADDIGINSISSLILGSLILLLIGVFVSTFIGAKFIISGLVGEKKIIEKEEEDIETEEGQLHNLQEILNRVEKKLASLEETIEESIE